MLKVYVWYSALIVTYSYERPHSIGIPLANIKISLQRQSEQELETLFNSLMLRAFRGELVPQDPNDESASELLKRIKEKRVAGEAKIDAEKRKSKENFLKK